MVYNNCIRLRSKQGTSIPQYNTLCKKDMTQSREKTILPLVEESLASTLEDTKNTYYSCKLVVGI
jgi:hypothetical protein